MTIPKTFSAIVARDGNVTIEQAERSLLYDGDTLVKIAYSCINYKDALAVTGKAPILRASPLIPGIDYAGEIVESRAAEFSPGDKVILTGNAVGEKHSGGFSAYAGADARWLVPLPSGMDEKQAMICGTAGLTAALCVLALTDSGHVKDGGKVVVSGASGGVGSVAVRLLSRLNYAVTAISRPATAVGDYLRALGAAEILPREEMSAASRPLEKSRWDGAVDCVGGAVLARILAEMNYGGVVAALRTRRRRRPKNNRHAVYPARRALGRRRFRDDSRPLRERAWALLAQHLTAEDYTRIGGETATLSQVPDACARVLAGDMNGRILVSPQE